MLVHDLDHIPAQRIQSEVGAEGAESASLDHIQVEKVLRLDGGKLRCILHDLTVLCDDILI